MPQVRLRSSHSFGPRAPNPLARNQLRHQERHARRYDLRHMPIGRDIDGRERDAGGSLLGAELRQPLQRLRRGQLGADDLAAVAQDVDRHETGFFLEFQPRRRFFRAALGEILGGGSTAGSAGGRDKSTPH